MQLVQHCTELYCNRKYSLLSQIGHLGVADRRPHKAGHQGDHQRLSQNVTYHQRLSHVVTDHQKLSQNFKDLQRLPQVVTDHERLRYIIPDHQRLSQDFTDHKRLSHVVTDVIDHLITSDQRVRTRYL